MEAAALPFDSGLDSDDASAKALELRGELFAPRGQQRVSHVDPSTQPWAGIGLCSSQLSVGLPVDVLALLCGLEQTRRALEAPQAWCLLADSNAIAVGFEPDEVLLVARRTEETLRAVCGALGFPVRFVYGSEVDRGAALENLPPYEAFQLAQMQGMARRGATVKVGWRLSGKARDEAYFDRLYEAHVPRTTLSFVYTLGGRTLDSRRPRACPYVVRDPQSRLMLRRDTHVLERLESARQRDEAAARGYSRFICKIGRELALLAGRRPNRCPEFHVQAILDTLPRG